MVLFLVTLTVTAAMVILLRPWPFFLTREQSRALQQRNAAAEFGRWVEKQASARGLKVRGVARQVPVNCPRCERASNYFVYPDELCERCWSASLRRPPKPAEQHRA